MCNDKLEMAYLISDIMEIDMLRFKNDYLSKELVLYTEDAETINIPLLFNSFKNYIRISNIYGIGYEETLLPRILSCLRRYIIDSKCDICTKYSQCLEGIVDEETISMFFNIKESMHNIYLCEV